MEPHLSPREKQLVARVVRGMTNRAIADELGLTEDTVKIYMMRTFRKVGVSSRTALAIWAMTVGPTEPQD